MSLVRPLLRLAHRFHVEERGVAAVEFALTVPFLIFLYFGSMEAAAAFTVDKRINAVSSTIGDLVAQWDPADGNLTTGSGGTLTDYLQAATGILAPSPTTGLQIVITLVQVKNDGTTKILWSRANGAGVVKIAGQTYSALGSSTQINRVSRGGCIVAAEVKYPYLPMLGQVFTTEFMLTHTNYFLPRFGSSSPIKLDTTPTLASDACTKQT